MWNTRGKKIELCVSFYRATTFGSWVLQHPQKCQNNSVKFGRKLPRFFSIFHPLLCLVEEDIHSTLLSVFVTSLDIRQIHWNANIESRV